jgi:hypothetical protein
MAAANPGEAAKVEVCASEGGQSAQPQDVDDACRLDGIIE